MRKGYFMRMIAVLLLPCLLSISLAMNGYAVPAITQMVAEQDGDSRALPPFIQLDYVKWGNNISGTTVTRTLICGRSKTLEGMGLNPTACANGTVSDSFSWDSSNYSVASVNAATGTVTPEAAGTAQIIGTSPFGSSHGQLILNVYVLAGEVAEISMVALWGDEIFHNTGFSKIGSLIEALELEEEEVRTYGGELPTERMTAEKFATYIGTSRIFYFRGHGTRTSVQIDKNGSVTTSFNTSYVNQLPIDVFSHCELVMYDACLTAEGGEDDEDNLINVTKNHGAQTVVGFQDSVMASEMDRWDELFFGELADGSTVLNACEKAREQIERDGDQDMLNSNGEYGSSTYIIAGDANNRVL